MKNPTTHATGASPLFWNLDINKDIIRMHSSCDSMLHSADSSCNSEEYDEKRVEDAGSETLMMSTLQQDMNNEMG